MNINIFFVIIGVIVFVTIYRFFYCRGVKQGQKQILEKICSPHKTTTGTIVDESGCEYSFSTTFNTQHIHLPDPEEERSRTFSNG